MVNFNVPNLCGANPNLNEALSKVDDLKKEITAKLDANPSDMVSALGAKIDDTIKQAAPSTSTAAQKLTDGINAFKKLF